MSRLIPVSKREDILPEYRDTPIGLLLEYHNLNRPQESYEKAQLLVGMCMDNRKYLKIPDNFSFILRSGGANLRYSEFKVSFAIAIGQVRYMALIGHTNCGMVNLYERKESFVEGLVNQAGWAKEQAEEHFLQFAPMFEIGNEQDFILSEVKRLQQRYPKVQIAPMLYSTDENKLYQIQS